MRSSLAFVALTLTIALVPQGAPTAAQTRPLTAADFPRVSPQAPTAVALAGLTGKALVERTLAPDDSSSLRLALEMVSPDFLNGAKAEEVIAALSALRAESMTQLLPAVLAPLEAREAQRAGGQAFAATQPTAREPAAATPLIMFAAFRAEPVRWTLPVPASSSSTDWPAQTQTFTAVNEYELVVNGMTSNVRNEFTFLFETRQVGVRIVTRETLEQNGDPAARGKYVVESGLLEPAVGKNTLTASHARKLKPTSTHRVTTESIREAKVDRCPDAAGLTRGQTLTSLTVRATAAATGGGSPSVIEAIARGTATGRVSDAAHLSGTDWEAKSETRMESLSAGENFRISQTMRMVATTGGTAPPSVTQGELVVSGVGSDKAGGGLLSAQNSLSDDGYAPLLLAYDYAEKDWRGGACVELTVASGALPKPLAAGAARKIVVEARHRFEPQPPALPVTSAPSGGAVTPGGEVRTPAAAVTFTADKGGAGGGAVSFSSVSKRGIARDVSVSFDPVEDDALLIRYAYTGFKFVDSSPEDCPSMRTGGQEVLTARVREVRSSDGITTYAGTGRFSADIDGCGLTPNRKDPGATGNGSGFGGFSGDNFIGCKVTTVAPDREVNVTLELYVVDLPQYLKIEFDPAGRAPDTRVTSTCEPAWHAEFVKSLTAEYRREIREEITDLDALQQMVLHGGLRPGTYQQTDGTSEGRWTLTVTKTRP